MSSVQLREFADRRQHSLCERDVITALTALFPRNARILQLAKFGKCKHRICVVFTLCDLSRILTCKVMMRRYKEELVGLFDLVRLVLL